MKTVLWLDLEDTVLEPVNEGWFNTRLVQSDKIDLVKQLIAEIKPDEVSIFSFAIWNEAERVRFNMGTRNWLENVLGVTFTEVLRVDEDIIRLCCSNRGLSTDTVDFSEMSNFWGKHDAFRICMHEIFKHRTPQSTQQHVVLIDDVVENETFNG
jgi:hypothetical protein